MNEYPAINPAGADPGRATYHPDVAHIFAPQLLYGHVVDHDASYAVRVHTVNMPYLARSNRQGHPSAPLSKEAQGCISSLAMQSITLPRGYEFGRAELVGAEAWLDGKAAGLSDREIAEQSAIPGTTLEVRERSLSSYLGASNQAHAMYLAFLHGYRPSGVGSIDNPPHINLTGAENLHFYLAALGMGMSQAANLLGVTENTVRQRRLGAYSQFGAENATQAIARAFEFRYYRSLETHEQVALFGLMDVLRPAGPTEGELTSSVAYEAALNRPPLVVVDNPTGRLGNGVERPLSVGARRRIERRAGALVTNPFQSEYTFAELQVKHVQALTDGLAQGKTQAQVARTLGVSLDVISRADGPAKRLRDHLGTNNPADTMYSMLLHGYRPADIELPPGSSPKLLQNMVLHLYLAALGYDTPNAMELTQHDKRVVVYNRKQAIDRLGARTLQQAVAHAFALGIFRSLPVANYRLAA